jgi:PleD family two-component response regulator
MEMSNIQDVQDNQDIQDNEQDIEKAQSTPSPKNKRRKIIIVDDVSFHLMSMRERLRKYYEVYPAQSAEALFELLKQIVPELILLDVNMPDCDGYEIIKDLKSDFNYSSIPVIFLSGKDDRQSIITGMKLGAVDYIRKPCTDVELHECIEFQLDPNKRNEAKPIVLAVDDSPSVLKSVNYILQGQNKVYTLPKPSQLTALLGMITPDLFLLDCNMPDLSGFDLVSIIRKLPGHEETPIVFLTAIGTMDNVSVAASLGACDFLIKPIDETLLREKISLHLKDYIMLRRLRQHKVKQ